MRWEQRDRAGVAVDNSQNSFLSPQPATFTNERRLHPPRTVHRTPPAISEHQIWLIAIGLIALDLTLFMVPIVPFLAAYVLLVRPPWFKDFIDDLYDRS